jgi:hypothetical protein
VSAAAQLQRAISRRAAEGDFQLGGGLRLHISRHRGRPAFASLIRRGTTHAVAFGAGHQPTVAHQVTLAQGSRPQTEEHVLWLDDFAIRLRDAAQAEAVAALLGVGIDREEV